MQVTASHGPDAVSGIIPELRQQIRKMTEHCNTYKGAEATRSLFQLITTTALFFAAIGLMLFYGGASLLLIPVAAGLLVRLFIIQHDCGHGSFFRSRWANDLTGRFLSVLTVTPYDFWRRAHNMHHAGSGNLHRRGIGSIDTLTVEEYANLSPSRRFAYRMYRHPFFLLVLGTPLHVLLLQRLPPLSPDSFIKDYRCMSFDKSWPSILLLNIAIVLFYGAIAAIAGWQATLLVFLPVITMTAWIGGWLFFIQHQFEDTHWSGEQDWNFHEAAVLGSSYYVLPKILQWFTGNIGLHHIHHLCPAIPNYRLQECLDASNDLRMMNRMTISQSLKCIWWALWDEKQKKLVSFRDLKQVTP